MLRSNVRYLRRGGGGEFAVIQLHQTQDFYFGHLNSQVIFHLFELLSCSITFTNKFLLTASSFLAALAALYVGIYQPLVTQWVTAN